ncbi:MAG: hypothetical protein AUK47_04525 [Deltaproteobacteria bacterium CG2_30_63_29]|nr:MAG: hypothetical protein AUK47_04525 [Deltaproteobacteria bacterium CG2_30_63_29]
MPQDEAVGRQKLLARAAQSPGETLRFFIALSKREAPETLPMAAMRGMDDSSRLAFVEERRMANEARYQALTRAIGQQGGTILSRFWLVDGLVVDAPAESVSAILGLADVIDGSLAEAEFKPEIMTPVRGYDGLDYDTRLNASDLSMFPGSGGSRSGGEIRLGIIETISLSGSNALACGHPGWLDSSGGPSRMVSTKVCTGQWGGICYPGWCANSQSANHQNLVSSIAMGSIEEGQDTNFAGYGTSAQKSRSGILPEAEGYYYAMYSTSLCDLAIAVQEAVADGVDVINISAGADLIGDDTCNPLFNACGVNEILKAALDAGVLTIKSAGNRSYVGTCNVSYPAHQPTVVAVTGVNNGYQPPISYEKDYPDTIFSGSGAAGAIEVVALDFSWVDHPFVALAAPFVAEYMFLYPETYLYPTGVPLLNASAGTSMAAPVVAGFAGAMRQALNDYGFDGNDARTLMVNTFLLGDGYAGGGYSWQKSYNTVGEKVGFGRAYARFPGAPMLGSSWGWESIAANIQPSQTYHITVNNGNPIPSSVLGLKWAFMTDWDAVYFPPKILLRAYDTCPSGGGAPVLLATDASASSSIRHKLRLSVSSTAGRCLRLDIQALAVPSSGVGFHTAYYYYSNEGELH